MIQFPKEFLHQMKRLKRDESKNVKIRHINWSSISFSFMFNDCSFPFFPFFFLLFSQWMELSEQICVVFNLIEFKFHFILLNFSLSFKFFFSLLVCFCWIVVLIFILSSFTEFYAIYSTKSLLEWKL